MKPKNPTIYSIVSTHYYIVNLSKTNSDLGCAKHKVNTYEA